MEKWLEDALFTPAVLFESLDSRVGLNACDKFSAQASKEAFIIIQITVVTSNLNRFEPF